MVKVKILLAGIALFGLFAGFMWLAPPIISQFIPGFTLSDSLKAWGFYLVLSFAILIIISAFLPYNWGKIFREIAYAVLFILILLVMMDLIRPFAKKIEVQTSDCENFFFPKGVKPTIVYNVIDYTSCILAGYYPNATATIDSEQKETQYPEAPSIAWTTFYIFYIILPFVFIVTIVYGVMKGIGIESMFGAFGGTATKILTIVIALYATRLLAGKVLLEFIGYGAWAFGALFGAILIVKGLQHMLESWYGVEAMAEETKKAIEAGVELARAYAAAGGSIIKTAKDAASKDLNFAKVKLAELRELPQYKQLSDMERNYLNSLINLAEAAGTPQQFTTRVNEIETFIKNVLKKEKK
jgi:hypothetical protein